jgi:peptide/nickel transport system substrate-binding protein
MQRKTGVLLAAAVLLLSAFGPASRTTAAAAPMEKVRVGLGGPIVTLDPVSAQDAPSYQVGILIAGQLFRFDANRLPQPDLAEGYRASEDGLTYTMTLHKGLKYSDGTPLSVDDVIYNWNRLKNLASINSAPIKNVIGVEASDANTLVWKLSSPDPYFIHFLGLHFLQVHPKAKLESDKDYFTHPVSAGPYYLKAWTPGSSTALLAENPNYVHGPMAIKQIEVVSVPDVTARTLQLAQGDLDFVFDLAPSVHGVIAKDVKTFAHPLAGMYFIAVNMALPKDRPLANRDVREAISLAIDREAISQKAFFGLSVPATGILYASAGEALVPNLPNGGKRDLPTAKAMLAKTPFKDGFTFTLGVWGTDPGWKEAALVIQQNLKDLNISARTELLDDAAAVQKLTNGSYDAMFADHIAYPVVTFLGDLFLRGSNWADWTRYDNPAMVTVFRQTSDIDPTKRRDAVHKIQELASQDLPFIAISERFVLSGTRIPGDLLGAVVPGDYLVVKTLAQAG